MQLICDIAQASITDYFIPTSTLTMPKVKIGLGELIKSKQDYIRREKEFANRKKLQSPALDELGKKLEYVEDEILRHQIELESNPAAYRIIDGEPELTTTMQLDINALGADKEKGNVKKLKITKDGAFEVERYPADAAQDRLMRYHGAFAPDKADITSDGKEINQVVIFQIPNNGSDKIKSL